MPWSYLVKRYLWAAVTSAALRWDRWSEQQKLELLFWSGVVGSGPMVVAQAYWVLTGRGPMQWLFRPDVAFVDPFPKWRPADPRGSLQRQLRRRREQWGMPAVDPALTALLAAPDCPCWRVDREWRQVPVEPFLAWAQPRLGRRLTRAEIDIAVAAAGGYRVPVSDPFDAVQRAVMRAFGRCLPPRTPTGIWLMPATSTLDTTDATKDD